MSNNLYTDQQRLMALLLAWGLGSVAAGAAALPARDQLVRQAGIQALSWGAIDALLALAGIRQGMRKQAELQRGAIEAATIRKDARGLVRLLLINAGLDVGYVATGAWLMGTAGERRGRRGAGLGILVQGSFLLAYDTALAMHFWYHYLREPQ